MNFDNLKTLSPDQLRELAGKQGLKVHHKAKPETIIKQIIESALKPATPAEMQHVAEKPQQPVHHNTPDDVEAAIADIKAKIPQFESRYDLDENTWYFKCKGAEECGNLAIPMRIIKLKAASVSRGRIALMGLDGHFDRGNAGGNSAYTNSVLAG